MGSAKGQTVEHLTRTERLRLFSLEKAQRDLNHVYAQLTGQGAEERARLYSMAPDKRTRKNGYKLKYSKLYSNIKLFLL